MKITDLKCTILGDNPLVRICTDEGVSGYGMVEVSKPYIKPHVLFYCDRILGEDTTNVEQVMLKIRRLGSFKPWGSVMLDRNEIWCDGSLPSVAVPLGLCRRTAVLRPPTVAWCSDRLTTGRPSTSTSL